MQQNNRPQVYIDQITAFGESKLAVYSVPSGGLVPYSGYFGKDGLNGRFVKTCHLSNGMIAPAWTYPISMLDQVSQVVIGVQTNLPPKTTVKTFGQTPNMGYQTIPGFINPTPPMPITPDRIDHQLISGMQNMSTLSPIVGETLITKIDGKDYSGTVTATCKDNNGIINNFTYTIGPNTVQVKLIPARWEIQDYPTTHTIERPIPKLDLAQVPTSPQPMYNIDERSIPIQAASTVSSPGQTFTVTQVPRFNMLVKKTDMKYADEDEGIDDIPEEYNDVPN